MYSFFLRAQPFFFLVALCTSSASFGSFLGDSIFISGAPNISPNTYSIDNSSVELSNSDSGTISFGVFTSTAGLTTGFIYSAPSYFNLDVSEASGGIQIDVTLAGSYDEIIVDLTGFDSTSLQLSNANLIYDVSIAGFFVDPNTQTPLPVAPFPLGTGSALGSALSFSHSSDSVQFSIAAGTYQNGFSLLVETTAVPVPAGIWLFGSALLSIYGRSLIKKL